MFRLESSEKVGAGSIIEVNMDERYLLICTAKNQVVRVNLKTMSVDFRPQSVEDVTWLSSREFSALFNDKCAVFPSDFEIDAKGIK